MGLVGSTSSLLKGLEALLSGDSASELFNNALIDLGVGLVLTSSAINSPLDLLINKKVEEVAQRKINRTYDKFTASLQKSLTAKISKALKLDANGRRLIVIGPDFRIRPTPPPPLIPSLRVFQYCAYQNRNRSTASVRWSSVNGATRYQVQKNRYGTYSTIFYGLGFSRTISYENGSSFRVRACSIYGCSNYSSNVTPLFIERCPCATCQPF